jgi:hypothetical protein
MSLKTRQFIAVMLITATLALLYPGLTQNALTIRGVLDAGGVSSLVERTVAAQMPHDQLAQIRPYLSATRFGPMNDEQLSQTIGLVLGAIAKAKITGAAEAIGATTVYEQKQTIAVTVRFLFENKSYLAGTLIFLFSVCIPLGKALLFFYALYASPRVASGILGFINAIGKWSMADVFLVAIYTAYLAARSSEGVGQAISFQTEYGPGFYWFAGYCVFSLAAQQAATSLLRIKTSQLTVSDSANA